ncbi:MAG TPA: DUF815 domain-containing protein, partial [Kiloniellaceae bacterium]
MSSPDSESLLPVLQRIAAALERLAPEPSSAVALDGADAFVWHPERDRLEPVSHVNRVDLSLLQGIGRQAETLYQNTRRFADGLPANNALLWGSRGAGKSSLVKAVHARVNEDRQGDKTGAARLALVEIHREDIPTLPRLLAHLRDVTRPCVLFCDDLSFDGEDASYKSLKAVLEGGIEGRPANVI